MSRNAARILLLVFCALAVAQETPFGSLAFGADCVDPCDDDASSGRCSVACVSCACASHARALDVSATCAGPSDSPLACFDALPCVRVATPLPDSIFHVPKLSR